MLSFGCANFASVALPAKTLLSALHKSKAQGGSFSEIGLKRNRLVVAQKGQKRAVRSMRLEYGGGRNFTQPFTNKAPAARPTNSNEYER